MKSRYFQFILPLLLLSIVASQSLSAIKNDSLQSLLINKLSDDSYKKETEVIEYLDITRKLYSESPTDALFYLNALEQRLNSEKNNTGKAYILSQKGTFYWLQGIYDAALKADFEALRLFEQADNSIEIIKILNNIGETYKKQKDYSQSARFIKLALSKVSDVTGISPELILVNLGQLFMLKENYDSANYYLNQILKRDSITTQSRAFTYLYKGIINRKIGHYDSAKHYFIQSLTYWDDLNYDRGTIESNLEIAKIYIDQSDFDKANQKLKEAENLASKINTLDLLLNIFQSKIDLFKIRGSKDSLVYYFDKYLEIKDSIYNSESRAEINKLSIQYNLADKEKERYKLALEQSQLTSKIEKRTQYLVLLLIVLIFAFILIFYLRNKSVQLKTAHLKLQQQNEEIEEKQRKISSKSLSLARVNKELHSLNNNLEQRVMERTQRLNERNKQIEVFTYYNSHKLRAPVANVLGLINVMELTTDGKIDPILLNHLKTSAMELDKVIFNLKNILELDEEIDENLN